MILQLHTFMFVDLCDFTAYSWHHGDEASATLAIDFHSLVGRLAEREGCQVVKTIGDAVMVRSDDPLAAVRVAQALHGAAGEAGLPELRIGLDSGCAAERAGDWYGTTVNTAARVCKESNPGEMWMTERTVDAIQGLHQWPIVARGQRTLKGLPECLLHAAEALERELAAVAA